MITGHFGFVFEKDSVREITWLSRRHRFQIVPVLKFSVSFHSKTQSQRF